MNHESHEEDLAALALGVLPDGRRPALEEHLRSGCAPCAARLREFRRAADALALAGPRETPPPSVREALFARIGAPPAAAARAAEAAPWAHWAAAAALFLAVGAGLFLPAGRSAPPELAVAWTEGRAESGGRALVPGELRRDARTVSTGPGSGAELVVDGVAAVKLAPDTTVRFARKDGGWTVRLSRGGLLSAVRPGTRYRVKLPTLSAAVRGTVFYVRRASDGSAYLCLCEGRLSVECGGVRRDLSADHHQALHAPADGADPGPAGMESHTDKDVARLTALIR